ncbi:hypothetical protein UlMin_016839 [Ulmus minor]
MSSLRQHLPIRDLAEEAKKRIVFLVICVVGLSYLMSLTSSSVWVNLPAAASIILILRYLSLDFEAKKKAAAYNSKPSSANFKPSSANFSHKKPFEGTKVVGKSEWRRKVNSPAVEDAIDQFTRHLISEWVTNLWYSRLTPDKEGPEELVSIINGALGEISARMRSMNLIDLLTRDLINLICNHLELFRATQAKIKNQSGTLTIEHRDMELRLILATENKLHPALFSAEAEHKVLQHLMDGLISFTFKPEDLQCNFFRYASRELLACAVMRPVLNLANPRFINERIESLVINMSKSKKAVSTEHEAARSKADEPTKFSSDHFSRFVDPSVTGVELVQLKTDESKSAALHAAANVNGNKDPLLSIDTRSTRSWSSLPMNSQTNDEGGLQRHGSGGEWGDMLDMISRRKTQALAPEHFENMWTKGRNYKRKEGENRLIENVPQGSSHNKFVSENNNTKAVFKPKEKETVKLSPESSYIQSGCTGQSQSVGNLYEEDNDENLMHFEEADLGSSTSYTSEDESSSITGLGSPGTKVWDGRNRSMTISHIHHPLENSEGHNTKRIPKGHVRQQRLHKNHSGRKRSRPGDHKVNVWQEVERTSFLSGDGQDILSSLKGHENDEYFSDDSDVECLGRVHSGAAASSSASSSVAESRSLAVNSLKSSLAVDSFYKLRCEVLGANIVKSGSRTFAVYSISVTDINNNSWSIKRRFRHFEELHRRVKEFSEYNLHLPPKHFLSTGLDVPVIQERCKLLDYYLKKLMQLPTVSGSIEVWDFLSVDSQTYYFSNSFSIIETLSVDLDDKPSEKSNGLPNFGGPLTDHVSLKKEQLRTENGEPVLQMKENAEADGFRLNAKGVSNSPVKKSGKEVIKSFDNSAHDSETRAKKDTTTLKTLGKAVKVGESDCLEASESPLDAATDPTLPTEWIPPNLSVPVLDLVDVIFQLHDGGWIRRKAFWVAKQILQLGMGDALDDWLIEKILLLRKGSVIASGVKRLEQILWPDGIFLTKHPKRRPPPSANPSQGSPNASSPRMDDEQQREANRRAKLVYELMIEKAPAAIVGLVGSKDYDQCVKDLYFFIQSSVCLKQLAYELLELILVTAFPEMNDAFKQLHEEKHKFGEFFKPH